MDQRTSPKHDPGGRRAMLTTPNPRRTTLTQKDVKTLHDGRKRQKLSHSPEKEEHGAVRQVVPNQPTRLSSIGHSQESGSSDNSASKWFSEATQKATTAQRQAPEVDGLLQFQLFESCSL